MSYKFKSLLYFAAFVASAFIYNAMNTTDEKNETVNRAEKLEKAISGNTELSAEEEKALFEEALLKK